MSFDDVRRPLTPIALVICACAVYSNTLNVPFYFDDLPNITENIHIRLTKLTLGGLLDAGLGSPGWKRPVANMSFALNYYFHQYDIAGYHLVNTFVHAITGIFLFLFLRTTLSLPALRLEYGRSSGIAFFAALLWLVHPLQTQSVTYVVQRMNSMASMFYVASLFFYARGRLGNDASRGWPWFAGSASSGILAFGCKEISATLPFFIFLYEWYFLQDLRMAWLRRRLAYLFGIACLCSLVAFLYLGIHPLEAILATYSGRDFGLSERVLTEFRVTVYYVSLVFLPHPSRLNLAHDFPLSHSMAVPITTSFSLGAVILSIGLAVYLARRGRLASFCILWFFGNLAIESSIIGLEIIFEHRTYLPSMLVLLWIPALVYRHIRPDWAVRTVLLGTALLLGLWTYERNGVWQDPVVFWQDSAAKSPTNPRSHNNLGSALQDRGRLDEAIAHYEEAVRLKPTYAVAHNNLGSALQDRGRLDEAVTHYSETLRLKPDDARAHYNVGSVLQRLGRSDEAAGHYLHALRLRPDYPEAHNNLGYALHRQGRLSEAIAHYEEALRLRPDYPEAHNNLGYALHRQGRLDEAIAHYEEALRLRPDYASPRNHLAAIGRRTRQAERPANGEAAR